MAPSASPSAAPIHTQGRRRGARISSLARAPASASRGIRPSTLFVRMAAPSGIASATCHRGRPRASRYTHTVAAIQKVSGTSIMSRRALSTKIGVARRHALPTTAAARPTVRTPIRHVSTSVPSASTHRGRRAARSRSPSAAEGPAHEPQLERRVLVRRDAVPGDGVDAARPRHLDRLPRVERVLERREAQVPDPGGEEDQRGDEEDRQRPELRQGARLRRRRPADRCLIPDRAYQPSPSSARRAETIRASPERGRPSPCRRALTAWGRAPARTRAGAGEGAPGSGTRRARRGGRGAPARASPPRGGVSPGTGGPR